eukprot:5841520-Prymnesium_polylepis.1
MVNHKRALAMAAWKASNGQRNHNGYLLTVALERLRYRRLSQGLVGPRGFLNWKYRRDGGRASAFVLGNAMAHAASHFTHGSLTRSFSDWLAMSDAQHQKMQSIQAAVKRRRLRRKLRSGLCVWRTRVFERFARRLAKA